MGAIIWHRIFSARALSLEMALISLSCLPLASRQILPDAAMTLLFPVTILGFLSAWWIASLKLNEKWTVITLTIGGLLILFIYIGNLGTLLAALGKETVLILGPMLDWLPDNIPANASAWMAVCSDLITQVAIFGERVALWLLRALQGVRSEDPVARAVVWSVGSWWLALWAGWQFDRENGPIRALLPVTVILGMVLRSGREQTVLLWVNLAALLLVLGLGNFEGRLRSWKQAGRDYVEATGPYSLLSTIALTMILVSAAYLASTVSVRDILDRLRDARRSGQEARAGPRHTETNGRSFSTSGTADLLRPHRITGGMDLPGDVVMIISIGDVPPMPRSDSPAPIPYYWRSMTYENYNGIGWTNSGTAIAEVLAGKALLESKHADYRLVRQTFRFPSGASGALYWTNTLLRVDVPIRAAWRSRTGPDDPTDIFGEADLLSASTLSDGYTAESLRLEVSEANLRGAPATYPAGIRKRYLELPASIPERVPALARNLTASAATPYDRALAIEAYLRRFPYSLEAPPPPPRRDAVDYFIFDLRKGYCDYYATAMVILSRAAGLPARFVTGYSSGSYDPESASYKVTEANAHSWAEIYFPGIGWVEFEPTASQPLPSRQGQGQPEALLPETTVRPESLAEQALIYVLRLRPGLLGIVAIVFVILWIWTPAASMLLAHFRPEQAVGRFYRGIRQTARSLTGPLPVSQTAHEYAAALSLKLYQLEKQNPFGHWIVPAHDELGYLTDLYTSSLFTVNRPDRTQLAEAARAWIRLRWRLLLARILFFLRRKPL